MKKLLAIVLWISFSFPFMGMTVWLKYKQYCIRSEFKQRILNDINKQELTILKFSKEEVRNNLEWEDATEFQFENEMYDVVQSEQHDDSIYYWCWKDAEETLLSMQLNALTNISFDQTPQKQENQKFIDMVFENLFIVHHSSSLDVYLFEESLNFNSNYSSFTCLVSVAPAVPPPKIS